MTGRLEQIWSGFEKRSGRPLTKLESKSMPEIRAEPRLDELLPDDYVNPSKAAVATMKDLLREVRGADKKQRVSRAERPVRAMGAQPSVEALSLDAQPTFATPLEKAEATYAELATKRRQPSYLDAMADYARRELEEARNRKGFFARLFGR